MNKNEWAVIKRGVLDFNRLITTEEERSTEAYYLKCCDLLQEEGDEGLVAKKKLTDYYRNRDGWAPSVELLDAWCDIIVTGIQLVDCVSPSQLEWDYCSRFLEEPVEDCVGVKHSFLSPAIASIAEAEIAGCDIYGAMLEVIRSNNSKIPHLSDVQEVYGDKISDMGSSCEWIEESLNYKFSISYDILFGKRGNPVLFKDQNNKLRKWSGYSEPSLEEFL